MSHRPEDQYGYVATEVIRNGMVTAFNPGDPVPDDTVKALGLDDAGLVCKRDEWEDRPEDEPERPMERGEMPAHLRDKAADTGKADDSATAKSVKAGGASRKIPEPAKSAEK